MREKVNLLAMETTGAKASVALMDQEGRLFERTTTENLNHLQYLIPMTEDLLSNRGLSIDDVSLIAISEGPGSFTGIRIGIATAKALAQALAIPVVSVPTLEAFAYHVPDCQGLICPIFDARRNQVYGGIYCWENGRCKRLAPDGAYQLEEYLELLAAVAAEFCGSLEINLFGDGIAPYGAAVKNAVEDWNLSMECISSKGDLTLKMAKEDIRYQSAASVAKLGYQLFQEGAEKSFFQIHPVYLRKAEAERKLEEAGRKL